MEGKKITLKTVILAAVLVIAFLPGFSRLQRLKEENLRLKKRIEFLSEYNGVLQDKVGKLENDPNYLEKRAREKLGIIKKGEIIYKPSNSAVKKQNQTVKNPGK